MEQKTTNRYLGLGLLIWGAGTIFNLVLFRFIAYEPLRVALDVSNTQYGLMMSVFSAAGIISYFPGGWLADRFSARKLLTVAYLSTGLAGIYFATFPSFVICLLIHAFWGFSTSLIFWAAMLKACKDMAGQDEQGRFFGILEGGRGLVTTAATFTALWLYNSADDPLEGLRWALIFQSILTISAAVVTWFLFGERPMVKSEASVASDTWRTIKNPMVWVAAGMVFSCCGAKACISYVNPYLTELFLVSVAVAGIWSTIWTYGCQFAGGPIGGIVADKLGHRPKVLMILFVLAGLLFLPLVIIRVDPALLVPLLASTTACFIVIYAIRGLYFAVVSDLGIPAAISGSAIGFISLVGFTPDVFVYPLAGYILDVNEPAAGYKLIFSLATGFSLLGALLAGLVVVALKRIRKSNPDEAPASA